MAGSCRYHTRQRERIWGYLDNHRGRHVTAEDIARSLRQEGETVGKTTVYRYLDYLVGEGLVGRYTLNSGEPACYQILEKSGGCLHHFHVKCCDCGKLLHVDSATLERLEQELTARYQFALDHTKTVLYGQCGECRAQKGEIDHE